MSNDNLSKKYRAKQLASQLDVSVPTIWRWSRQGLLPKPIKLSDGVTVWDADAVAKALGGEE